MDINQRLLPVREASSTRQPSCWPPESKGPSAAESAYILTLRVPRQTSPHISRPSSDIQPPVYCTHHNLSPGQVENECVPLARVSRLFYPVGNKIGAISVRRISNQFSAGRQPASIIAEHCSNGFGLWSSMSSKPVFGEQYLLLGEPSSACTIVQANFYFGRADILQLSKH